MKSDCKKIRRQLSAFLDGALSPAEQERSARHIAHCPACRRELAALEHLTRTIADVPREEVPDGFGRRLSARIDAETHRAKWMRRLFVPLKVKLPLQFAATAALAVAIFFLVTPPLREKGETPPPQDAPAPAAVAERSDAARAKQGIGAVGKSIPLAEQTAMQRPLESDAPAVAVPLETVELTLVLTAETDASAEQRYAMRSGDKEELAGSAAAPAAAPPVPSPEGPKAAVRRVVAEAGGTFVEGEPGVDQGRPGSLTIEVPAASYERLLNDLRSLGRLDPMPAPPADRQGRVRIQLRLEGPGPQ